MSALVLDNTPYTDSELVIENYTGIDANIQSNVENEINGVRDADGRAEASGVSDDTAATATTTEDDSFLKDVVLEQQLTQHATAERRQRVQPEVGMGVDSGNNKNLGTRRSHKQMKKLMEELIDLFKMELTPLEVMDIMGISTELFDRLEYKAFKAGLLPKPFTPKYWTIRAKSLQVPLRNLFSDFEEELIKIESIDKMVVLTVLKGGVA